VSRSEGLLREQRRRARGVGALSFAALLAALALAAPLVARAQQPRPQQPAAQPGATVDGDLVQLDFTDVELPVVIDTIARLTGKNFIYDDRVRGRVTIVSPTKITVEQAYAVFESVLQVKGFTVVPGPGGARKVIPIREAKESPIETMRGEQETPDTDRFITRLIPLRYIDAQAITDTLKPLVSKDASMMAYPPTNTVILTDSASNISRILDLIGSIDVETYKEELTVIKIRHADATVMADQLSQIFEAEVSDTGTGAQGVAARARARRPAPATPGGTAELRSADRVRLITDARTNSLIVLAARQRLDDIRTVVAKLDVPVSGGGRIHVYYLKHADSEELSQTLNALISGQAVPSSSGTSGGRSSAARSSLASVAQQAATAGAAQAMRSAITELAEGVTITADPPTNSLVIQASQEGFSTVKTVIDKLDVPRPQVLVEALIMEIDISDAEDLGFSGLIRIFDEGKGAYGIGSLTDTNLIGDDSDTPDDPMDPEPPASSVGGIDVSDVQALLAPLLASAVPTNFVTAASVKAGSTLIQGVIRASATVNGTNILSSPNILTSDNEEAEIKVGANIPIITSRVQSAAGIDTATGSNLATSVNVERQDIGVTLRVTPQISEGDAVRLEIFQEITDVNEALSGITGNTEDVGVSLSSRKVENTVVVSNHETVVIGGLISDAYRDNENKIPWLGDIPFLGWLFKTTGKSLTKTNLLVFLTPHIVRTPSDLERETIRKREEFWQNSEENLELSEREMEEAQERRAEAEAAGIDPEPYVGKNPVRAELVKHDRRYPLDRMRQIEEQDAEARRRLEEAAAAARSGPGYAVLAAVYRSEAAAQQLLTELVDAGYDGTLLASESGGGVLYEIRLGPFAGLQEAQFAADAISGAFGLSPEVVVDTSGERPSGEEPSGEEQP
jgi:general secretion pathway protein D